MADHHAVDGVSEMAEDSEFMGFHEIARSLNAREFMVGVEARRGVTGKVLAATQHAGGAETIIEGAGFLNHLGHIATVATASKRIVGFVVE